uniref:Uncharacterized protein n=1 Tax=Arundo donax TaxID=35708 RepID=A0A0A9HTQ5_ARUDO
MGIQSWVVSSTLCLHSVFLFRGNV